MAAGDRAEPVFRRALDALLPFMIGLALGITTTIATLSGRITRVETLQTSDHADISDLKGEIKEQGRILRNIAGKLGVTERP